MTRLYLFEEEHGPVSTAPADTHACIRTAWERFTSRIPALAGAPLPPVERTKNGKPFFLQPEDAQQVALSVSHSGRYLAVALSEALRIGVDIEDRTWRFRKTPYDPARYARIARRFFYPTECALIAANEDPLRHEEAFFYVWTSKEAAGKRNGEGIPAALSSFSIDSPDPAVRIVSVRTKDPRLTVTLALPRETSTY